jgi:hypothetical protein
MITYNKIEPQTVEVWNENGFFARVDYFELNDIRIQIKNEKASGWYVMFNGSKIRIHENGKLESWPAGFFELIDIQLDQLVSWD